MKLPMPQPADFSDRVKAMLNALVAQRNQTADEVVNLAGDLAEARREIADLKERLAKYEDAGPRSE